MDRTVIATRDNFDERYPDSDREQFWELVRNTLRLFDVSPDLSEEYRRKLRNARAGERIAVYHTSPLVIAADLAGRSSISEATLRGYLELQRTYAKQFGLSLDLPSHLPR